MVNIGFSWNSLLGIALALSGAGLYFLRSVRPSLARDHDIFFAAVGLLCGGILFFQGWRQDPILQFGQFLLTGSVIFFAVESIRLRGIATEQAKRNVPFVDEERPVSQVYRAELDELESMPDPQPYTRRIRGTDDPRDDLDAEYAAPYAAPTRSRRRPPSDPSRRPPTESSRRPPGESSRRPRPDAPPRRPRRPAARPGSAETAPPTAPPEDQGGLGDWGESDWEQPSTRPSRRPPSRRPAAGSPPPRRRPNDPLANERTGYVYGSSYEDEDPPVDESYVDYQPIDPEPQDTEPTDPKGATPSATRAPRTPGWADEPGADEVDNSADFDDADDFDDDPRPDPRSDARPDPRPDPRDRRFDANRHDSDRYDSDRYDSEAY
jgi:hypothetical protein